MTNTFDGIFPAIVSPCDEEGNFDEKAFAAHVDFLYSHDVRGLYLCGGTGDGPRMSLEERERAVEIAAGPSKAKDKKMIVQVAAPNTRDAVRLAAHAAENNAHAISSLAPTGVDFEHLVVYYQDLRRACDLPLLVYYIPNLAGQPKLSVEQIIQLLDLEGVRGLKITDWNMSFVHRLHLHRPESVIYNGMDECLYFSLLAGANGGIGMFYNLFPRLFVEIFKSMREGDTAKAWELQSRFLDFSDLYLTHGVKNLFEFLMRKRRLIKRCFRKPMHSMSPNVEKQVEKQVMERTRSIEEALAR